MVNKPAARDVVEAVAVSARHWTDRNYEPRRSAVTAVVKRTGYSLPVAETALDRLFGPLNAEAIEAAIAAELGSLAVLDRFVARAGTGRVRALPIGRACILSSRTTIGVALLPAIFALCAGCNVLVKDREDGFIKAFFETLWQEEPALRQRAAASAWIGENDPVDFASFDVVVAFGSNDTLSGIARRLPLHTRFVPHGPPPAPVTSPQAHSATKRLHARSQPPRLAMRSCTTGKAACRCTCCSWSSAGVSHRSPSPNFFARRSPKRPASIRCHIPGRRRAYGVASRRNDAAS